LQGLDINSVYIIIKVYVHSVGSNRKSTCSWPIGAMQNLPSLLSHNGVLISTRHVRPFRGSRESLMASTPATELSSVHLFSSSYHQTRRVDQDGGLGLLLRNLLLACTTGIYPPQAVAIRNPIINAFNHHPPCCNHYVVPETVRRQLCPGRSRSPSRRALENRLSHALLPSHTGTFTSSSVGNRNSISVFVLYVSVFVFVSTTHRCSTRPSPVRMNHVELVRLLIRNRFGISVLSPLLSLCLRFYHLL
jgi:hypothetical protein